MTAVALQYFSSAIGICQCMPTRYEGLATSIKLTWPFEQGCDRGQTSKHPVHWRKRPLWHTSDYRQYLSPRALQAWTPVTWPSVQWSVLWLILISDRSVVVRIVQAIPANPYACLRLLHIDLTRFRKVRTSQHYSSFSIIDKALIGVLSLMRGEASQ